jgi:tetratricopeptide (TPR) repeat protein
MTATPPFAVSPWRRTAGAALLLAVAACATPLQVDRSARAPDLPGFGSLAWPAATSNPTSRKLFEQGVLQAHAFNEAEAIRLFKAALAQDPACALCAWGVAWKLGPNINDTGREQVGEARRWISLALQMADGLPARERALIDALALRYGHDSQAKAARDMAPLLADRCGGKLSEGSEPADPLDLAYAERLRTLVQASPTDPELLSLWAEAEMVATRSDWWDDDTGKPGGRIGDVTSALEAGLKVHPQHTGLNHYLIHAADSRTAVARGLAAADRMGSLAPASPHLVHMPSHLYARVGRYADATRVNEEAVAAELTLFAAQKSQGFTVSKDWRNHNQQFLLFGALMEGRGDAALKTARDVALRAEKPTHEFAEYRRSLPIMSLLRLERWQAVLAEPLPRGDKGMAVSLGESAKATAHARLGQLNEARAALARAEAGRSKVATAHAGVQYDAKMLRGLTESVTERARAELASAEGRHDDALKAQAQALKAARVPDLEEPPLLAASARATLGDLQLRAGRAAEAEKTFREDLALQPGNGWALRGLAQALDAQGRSADALTQQAALQTAWAQADATVKGMPPALRSGAEVQR